MEWRGTIKAMARFEFETVETVSDSGRFKDAGSAVTGMLIWIKVMVEDRMPV
jgi:hypothetical protein